MNRTLIIAVCAVVFLAAATVPRIHTAAGAGEGAVSGYTVSDVHYALGDTGAISGVSFRLDATARTVEVRLGGRWERCSVSGRNVTCTFAGRNVPVEGLRTLAVSAVS